MHNIFGKEKRDANEALSAKEEVIRSLRRKLSLRLKTSISFVALKLPKGREFS